MNNTSDEKETIVRPMIVRTPRIDITAAERSKKYQAKPWHCELCNKTMTNGGKYNHERTIGHINNVKKFNAGLKKYKYKQD